MARSTVRWLHGSTHRALDLSTYLICVLLGFSLGALCCGLLCAQLYT